MEGGVVGVCPLQGPGSLGGGAPPLPLLPLPPLPGGLGEGGGAGEHGGLPGLPRQHHLGAGGQRREDGGIDKVAPMKTLDQHDDGLIGCFSFSQNMNF